MKIYKCDICGKEINKDEEKELRAHRGSETGYFGLIIKRLDVCKRCLLIGKGIDFESAMIGAWKYAVKEAE